MMYSIGRFSTITKIPCKTIRYYDEIGLLKPAYVDDDNNYRYYDHSSILQAQQILIYRNCGLPLEEIKKLITDNKDNEDMYKILKSQLDILDQKINEIHISRSRLEEIIQSMEEEKMYPVELIRKEEQIVLSLRQRGDHDAISSILSKLFETVAKKNFKVTGPHAIIWHEEKDFTKDDIDMEIYVPVEKNSGKPNDYLHSVSGGQFCYTTHRGSIATLSSAYERIHDYIEKNNYEIAGSFQETYSFQENSPAGRFMNPNAMEIEVAVPVKKITAA